MFYYIFNCLYSQFSIIVCADVLLLSFITFFSKKVAPEKQSVASGLLLSYFLAFLRVCILSSVLCHVCLVES